MAVIKLTTEINAPIQRCFDLSRSIDLHTHSTSKTKEKAVAGRTSGLIEMNESVIWRAKHFGMYQNLTVNITRFDAPHYFKDEMTKGIFRSLKHDHFFAEKNEVTTMRDVFEFRSPFGFAGKVADKIFLSSYLKKFLKERNLMIKQAAETEEWKKFIF